MNLFLCVGCNKKPSPPTTLANPVLTWSSPYFQWEEVPGADKYEVVLNDEVIYTYNNYIEITSRGAYSIKVKSISDSAKYNNSGFSNQIDAQIKNIDGWSLNCWTEHNNNSIRIFFSNHFEFGFYEYIEVYTVKINDYEEIVNITALDSIYNEQTETYDYYLDFDYSLSCFVDGSNSCKVVASCVNNYYLPLTINLSPIYIEK